MYIAFKWLVGLALTMWLSVCWIDMLFMTKKEITSAELSMKSSVFAYKNVSAPSHKKPRSRPVTYKYLQEGKGERTSIVHYIMFFAGVLAVSVFNKKKEIILFTRHKIIYIGNYIKTKMNAAKHFHLKETAIDISVATRMYVKKLFNMVEILASKSGNITCNLQGQRFEKPQINLILLNKLREIGKERQNLGRLLIAAIHENKNIRTQYHLEVMAKNRLIRYAEDTQKIIKENRSKYINFQHLYLVTHQENIFLKARIKKITKEKENAEINLFELVKQVYRSKNKELMSYCSRFIVQSRDQLLNSDINSEIEEFLLKSQKGKPSTSKSNCQYRMKLEAEFNTNSSYNNHSYQNLTDVLQNGSLIPLVSEEPKLKGLPGEYVWTVKDKNGIIEKLYEYNYDSDLDNGDTIRRIRQYSVYYDKDCLLDFSRENNKNSFDKVNFSEQNSNEYELRSKRFLTGSEAFKEFLRNNKNIVASSSSTPTLLN